MKLKDIISKVDIGEEWRQSYIKFVPEFIESAINNPSWETWEESLFYEFFERGGGQCVSSLSQGYFELDERQKIKSRWNELSPLLTEIAKSQTVPLFDCYNKIKNIILECTRNNKRAATSRLIASLQPDLLCTIVKEDRLRTLFGKLKYYQFDNLPVYSGDWFKDSYNMLQYFKQELSNDNCMEICTLPWQVLKYLEENSISDNNNSNTMNTELVSKYKTLLENNHNLILTGAPGTGKTYLAKEIAKAMGCSDDEIGFVQFHPSYDYTDFVEGLRPIQDNNGTVGFERTDGVFKEFCKKALENWTEYENFRKMPKTEIDESKKTQEVLLQYFDYIENQLISQDGGMIDFLSAMKIRRIIRNKKGEPASIEIATSLDATTKQNLSVNVFCRDYIDFKNKKILSYRDVKPTYESTRSYHGNAYYYFRLYELVAEFERSENFDKSRLNDKQDCEVKLKNFVFIIDEINRGEISKIFGELFFSIDPGYRGVDENGNPKGLVQTQYQNLVEDDDDFKKGFYVPENVYIIGTMNDIDRSVESMDFAFRRRFAFKEITAKYSQKMFDNDEAWDNKKPDVDKLKKLKNRMNNLNDKISAIPGLNSAYHIGAAYFLKLKYYEGDDKDRYNVLWNNHLNGVLREYLRGIPKIEDYMTDLRKAYDDESEHTKTSN